MKPFLVVKIEQDPISVGLFQSSGSVRKFPALELTVIFIVQQGTYIVNQKGIIKHGKSIPRGEKLANLLLSIKAILFESLVKKWHIFGPDVKWLPILVPCRVEDYFRLVAFLERNIQPVGMLLGRMAPPAGLVVERSDEAFSKIFQKVFFVLGSNVAFFEFSLLSSC